MEKYGEEVAAETGVCVLVCVYGAFIQERHSTSEVRWKERRGERNKNLRPGLVAPDPSNPAHTHLIIKSTTHSTHTIRGVNKRQKNDMVESF
jgi:hypothetical protein